MSKDGTEKCDPEAPALFTDAGKKGLNSKKVWFLDVRILADYYKIVFLLDFNNVLKSEENYSLRLNRKK